MTTGPEGANDVLQLGDIVEVVDSADSQAVGCLGEIIEVGERVKVAVVHVFEFKPSQLKKNVDLTGLSWNELRARAKELGLAAVGKRDQLEAAVKEEIKTQGRAETMSIVTDAGTRGGETVINRPFAAVRSGFRVGQRVEVIDTKHDCFRARGPIVSLGPPIKARVRCQGDNQELPFKPDQLKPLEP